MLRQIVLFTVGTIAMAIGNTSAAEISVQRSENDVIVKIDGQLFTEYLIRSGTKPILWPILGPTGKPMTRAYPMQQGTKETKDHVHQRSLWCTHGNVNGVDFWMESPGKGGTIQHRQFVKVEGGLGPEKGTAVVVTQNDWLDPKGNRVCEDERTLTFGADDHARWIDFDIKIKATAGPVTFGDTKEGTFAVRVPETIRVDSKRGGRIINSRGQTDAAAWGKPAEWVDYYGPVEGQVVGVAILNHPHSFRFPTYWHVRTYGLFAANPFGLKEFTNGEKQGAQTIASGETLTLRYRVLLHRGDEKQGRIAEAFKAYAKLP
jgi:hypothetical protein